MTRQKLDRVFSLFFNYYSTYIENEEFEGIIVEKIATKQKHKTSKILRMALQSKTYINS